MSKSNNNFIIDNMVWSFSRLQSYCQCPHGFKLRYIDCVGGEENFFSQYGSFMHKILEKYVKGELSLFDISPYWEDNFAENVTYDAPPNKYVDIKQSYYDKGLEYLDNIDLDLDNYEILGVEKECKFKVGDYDMIGYIDLLLRDKQTGEITVLDHKSGSVKFKKNGEVASSEAKHILDFKRQLYLYSIAVIEEYGVKPKYLRWNLFKDRNRLQFEFNEDEFEEAEAWVIDTITRIKSDSLFSPIPQQYFCYNLCDMRNCACEYKPA